MSYEVRTTDRFDNHFKKIYQTKEEYLSGDVVKKLEEAQYAVNSGDTRFENNVNALIGVQPAKRDYRAQSSATRVSFCG